MDIIALQNYWWFIISLLAGLLVFLFFVQGANSQLLSLGKTNEQRKLIVNATGRKWEFTFTTLVVFGGAFFASFPLFYSTSFGGAYWLWMIILFTFVLHAVSYEFQSKKGNLLGKKSYQGFLILNGILGPFLVGVAVATFFTGSPFSVNKGNMTNTFMPIISQWDTTLYGLDGLLNLWNLIFGVAIVFLSRTLGSLYIIESIDDTGIMPKVRKSVLINAVLFLIPFLIFFIHILFADGYAVNPENKEVFMLPYKYWNNLIEMPWVFAILLLGVILLLGGILTPLIKKEARYGFWISALGTVLAVIALFFILGYNNTAYYPSYTNIQSSLTIANSSSSLFTLKTMFYVSLVIPFVLAYIFFAWRAVDRKKVSTEELEKENHVY